MVKPAPGFGKKRYVFPPEFLAFLEPLGILSGFPTALTKIKAGNSEGLYDLVREIREIVMISKEKVTETITKYINGQISWSKLMEILALNRANRASLNQLEILVNSAMEIFNLKRKEWETPFPLQRSERIPGSGSERAAAEISRKMSI